MKDDGVYLRHARDAVDAVLTYTASGREHFFADRRTQDAVVRNLEIIGEAVKRLSVDLRNAYPDVPWRQIAGMRDKLVHEDQRREAERRIEKLFLEGVRSGRAKGSVEDLFKRLRRFVDERAGGKKVKRRNGKAARSHTRG